MSNDIVYYDSKTKQYRLNRSWAPSYSGLNKYKRKSLAKDLWQAVDDYNLEKSLTDMAAVGAGEFGEGGSGYVKSNSGDPVLDRNRAETDALRFSIERRGKTVEQMLKEEAKASINDRGWGDTWEEEGWKGSLAKALNNRAGSGVIRALDVISRPGYAVAEAVDSAGEARSEQEKLGNVGPGISGNPAIGAAFFKGAWRGLSGKDKTTPSSIIKDKTNFRGKPASVVGFIADVLGDPSTYVSLGTANFIKSGGKEAVELAAKEGLEDAAVNLTTHELKAAVAKGGKKGAKASAALESETNKLWKSTLKRNLDTVLEDQGIKAKPVREVVDDIESIYNPKHERYIVKDIDKRVDDTVKAARATAARSARKEAKAEAAASGKVISKYEIDKIVKKKMLEAQDVALKAIDADIADEAATRAVMKNDKVLQVKFAGNTVAQSEKAGKFIAKGASLIRKSPVGKAGSYIFRSDNKAGTLLHNLQRRYQNVGLAHFTSETMQMRDDIAKMGLTKKERIAVTHAIEAGSSKGLTEAQVKAFNYVKEFNAEKFRDELVMGLHQPEDHLSNYMYHVYRGEPERGLKSTLSPTRKKQKFNTIAEAKEAGVNPLEDFADIMAYRNAKSFRIKQFRGMMQEIADRFGVDLSGDTVTKKALRGRYVAEMEGKQGGLKSLVEGRNIGSKDGNLFNVFDSDLYFDKDTAEALMQMTKLFSSNDETKRLLRFYDTVLSRLKYLQTAPNPGFHIRNTKSDIFMNYLAGVTNPKRYRQAERLVRKEHDTGVKVVLKNGEILKHHEIMNLYDGMGLRSGYFHADAGLIPEEGTKILRGTGSKIRQASENREDIMRVANWINSLETMGSAKMSVDQIAEMAAKNVKKYNFDYQDLTSVEQSFFRRVIPFYTFMRKNVPVMLESLATQPGKMIVPTKANTALASFMGYDNRDDPLPGIEGAYPKWITDYPGAFVQHEDRGSSQDPVFIQTDMPYNQVQNLFGGFAEGNTIGEHVSEGMQQLTSELMTGQSSPLIRGTYEYATQKNVETGMDKPQGIGDAILGQFPVGKLALTQTPITKGVRHAMGKSGVSKIANPDILFVEGEDNKGPFYTVSVAGNKIKVSETVANYFTAIDARKVTNERMQSELRRREDMLEQVTSALRKKQAKRKAKEWEDNLPPGYDIRNPDRYKE